MSDMDPEVRIVVSRPGRARKRWRPVPDVSTWSERVAWLKQGGTGGKYARPHLPVTLRESPGVRSNANLDQCYELTLDADHAPPDYIERINSLGYTALSYTTASWKEHEPRWRTHIPLDEPVSPAEKHAFATHLIERIGAEYFDRQASTSPAHVAYAPAWDNVQYVDHAGPVLSAEYLRLVAPEPTWTARDSIGAITLDEWRDAHPVTLAPECHYGRSALSRIETEMLDTPEGSGVHRKVFHAARRAVELVGAGCWDLDDVDRLQKVALGMRTDQRPEEWPEALINALKKGDQAVTDCGRHGTTAADDFGEYLEPVDGEADDETPWETFASLDLVALLDPDRPPREWLWDGLIPTGDQAAIVAPGGTGKSLLVLDLALKAAAGEQTFIGRPLKFDGQVFYLDMENSEDDWAERLLAYGWTQESIARIVSRLHVLSLPPLAGLDTKHGAAQLKGWLKSMGAKAGDLLVLDSMQRITEGEENSNDTMRMLYTLTSAWLKSMGVTTIRTDNTGKDESLGARGASAKRDDVGYSFTLRTIGDKKKGRFSLESTKHRAAGDGAALVFDRILDPETGHLAWVPVGAEDALTDFSDLDDHDANMVLAAWLLTDPASGPNFEDDWVSQARITGLSTGATETRRARLEKLVSAGYLRKENLPLVKDPSKNAASPSYGITAQGKEWIAEKGKDWVADRRGYVASRADKNGPSR
jgi:hypothetical protein